MPALLTLLKTPAQGSFQLDINPNLTGPALSPERLPQTPTPADNQSDPKTYAILPIEKSHDVFGIPSPSPTPRPARHFGHDCSHGQMSDGDPPSWYCCSCGDGPIGDWNNVCINCGHVRDSGCTTD